MGNINAGSLIDRYQRLIELSRDLASTLDLDVLLNRIVHTAADMSNAEAASIMIYDDSKKQLYFQAATNLDKPLMRGLLVPVDESIAGWIYTHREPLIVPDVSKDDRYFGHIEQSTHFTTYSILGVPLITKNKVIGVLEAINKQQGDFTLDDQEILMAMGAQAAVAIENARLFQQSDLISEFVHELRTPLSSVTTAAHLLLRPEISEEQRNKMAQLIHDESVHLSEMATSFLDLARLESGRTQFNFDNVDLVDMLEECARIIRVKVTEMGLNFHVDIDPNLPSHQGDRDKLKQVFLNLLSNAYKYNRYLGTISLTAKMESGNVVIEVSDTGRGIPKEDIPHLFNKFYRVPGTEKLASGTGLGLSIAKRIVDAHGGIIIVTSELGQGTTFTVSFPANQD